MARFTLLPLLLLPLQLFAQTPKAVKTDASAVALAKADTIPAAVLTIARSLPQAELRTWLYGLAAKSMEGRRMATRGDTASARFVAARFAEQHLSPPTHAGYFQAVTAKRRAIAGTLSFGTHSYARFEGWNLYAGLDSVSFDRVPVVYAGADSGLRFMERLQGIDLSGKIVLVPGMPFRLRQFDAIDSIEAILKARGARALLWSDAIVTPVLERRRAVAFLPEYVAPVDAQDLSGVFPEISLVPQVLGQLLAGESGLSVADDGSISGPRALETFVLQQPLTLRVRTTYSNETAPNVLGILGGTDPSAGCIVVTAHRDHDGMNGKEYYPGAVDNASGTVALLELARMMRTAADQGYRPTRTIVFASVTGEERGLLGSTWYTEHPAIPLEKTRAVLNIDMLGRVDTFYRNRYDSNYVYVLISDSAQAGLADAVEKANGALHALHLDDRYTRAPYARRMANSSDHYPFALKKVPYVYYFTGFCDDYHKVTDKADKINYDLLTKQTQLAFVTLWNMANNK